MADIIQLPTSAVPHQRGRPDKIYYEEAANDDGLVWRICYYMNLDKPEFKCKGCPKTLDTEYGKIKNGCRSLAEEAIAIVLSKARK